jgi:hypothetical protein
MRGVGGWGEESPPLGISPRGGTKDSIVFDVTFTFRTQEGKDSKIVKK